MTRPCSVPVCQCVVVSKTQAGSSHGAGTAHLLCRDVGGGSYRGREYSVTATPTQSSAVPVGVLIRAPLQLHVTQANGK